MRREQALRRRVRSLETLREAVEAMRSLAAHHFRSARAALPAGRAYRRGVEELVAGLPLPNGGAAGAHPGLVVVASDLGLCGAYNSTLARAALERFRPPGAVYCVGRRAVPLLARAAIQPAQVYPAPVSVDGLTDKVLFLAQDLLARYLSGEINSLTVVSARFEGVGKYTAVATEVLPIPAVTRRAETPLPQACRYASMEHLIAVAVREFLFITLFELLLDAVAAEHGARLLSTEAARTWLNAEIETGRRRLLRERRESGTQEVLEIAAGAQQHLHPLDQAEDLSHLRTSAPPAGSRQPGTHPDSAG